jgi:chemotaxis protein CheC
MTDTTENFDEHLRSLLEVMAQDGIHRAAEGFSGMMGRKVTVSQPKARLVPFAELPYALGGPENEAVGIYLQMQGQIGGQVMLALPYTKALDLVDLLMEVPTGTTQQLGSLERSALAEVGNITTSFFLNAIATSSGLDVRPSPPAVIVDMIGAIVDVIVATSGGVREKILMIEAEFVCEGRSVEANFWMIPDPATLEKFSRQEQRDGR